MPNKFPPVPSVLEILVHLFFLFTGSERSRFREHQHYMNMPNNIPPADPRGGKRKTPRRNEG